MITNSLLKRWTSIRYITAYIIFSFSFIVSNEHQPFTNKWIFPIIPHPQEIYLSEECQDFVINIETQILLEDFSSEMDSFDVCFLNEFLRNYDIKPLKMALAKQPLDSNNSIFILKKIINNHVLQNFPLLTEFMFSKEYPGPEGYLLHITPNYVLLAGNDLSGRYYGIQTLIQLIFKDGESGNLKIKPVTIIDYPDMPLRSAFYGFYLNAMEDDSLIQRAYRDFKKISHFKFNMIDLASHHYGHLEMVVPGHPEEKLWQRFAKLHKKARRYYLRPRVGGWAKWVNTHSPWGSNLTTLECIRASQIITMEGKNVCTLKISSGQNAPNVIYDFATGRSWEMEPVIVTDETGSIVYEEGKDYVVDYGEIQSKDYQNYFNAAQRYLHVLFNRVHYGDGEPEGYPLRWGETFNPPTTIRRLEGSRILDGQRIKVTFSYIGPDPWSLIKVRYCRSDERLHNDSPENYIWRWCTDPIRFWGADDFSIDVDETRVFAWDKRCQDSGKSRSQIWADDIRFYYQTIRKTNPDARISMCSDMLDPAHNAKIYKTEDVASIFTEYNMTDIIMIPWKSKIAHESVSFFSERDFPVMPSCMEETEKGISDAPKWAYWIRYYYDKKELPNGLMHCHWGYGFDSTKTWEQLATVADHAWSVAPYVLHKPVKSAHAGKNIKITARFEGDKFVYDGKTFLTGPLIIESVFLHYRTNRQSSFQNYKMDRLNNEYVVVIPGKEVKGGLIEYYISMTDKSNTTYCPKQAENQPFKIKIEE